MGIAMYDANPDLGRPWTLPSGMRVQVGKGRTHRTHHLCWYKGVFYCRRCGHYGQENHRILKLVEPCYEQDREHQNIRRMKRLEDGEMPASVRNWPRPNNIPGEGLKGILQPRTSSSSGASAPPPAGESPQQASTAEQPGEAIDWDDLLFVDPRATFEADVDEEPWYWGVLDEEPPDFCPPMLAERCCGLGGTGAGCRGPFPTPSSRGAGLGARDL